MNTDNTSYCPAVILLELPVIIVLVGLIATTAASAWLLRRVEHELPALALLPAGKMVEQAVAHDTTVAMQVGERVVAVTCTVGNIDDKKPITV